MYRPIIIRTSLLLFLVLGNCQLSAKTDPLIVGAAPLSSILINTEISVPGSVISLNETTISAEVTGLADKVLAETGDEVSQGQVLLNIDCRTYELSKKQAQAALKVAKTQLKYANQQFKRNQRLVKRGIIPRETFEKVEASRATALADIELKKAAIESALLAIARCQIKAPFAGQITQRLVQRGQLVVPGSPLFKLLQNSSMEVVARIPPEDLKKLQAAPKLSFVANNQSYHIKLRSIIQSIDETSRTQEVRFSLPSKLHLATGLPGRVVWQSRNKRLPAEYVIRRNGQLGVMLVADIKEGIGKARFYPLLHAHEGQPAEVDLPANSQVITLNRYRAKQNQLIKIQ